MNNPARENVPDNDKQSRPRLLLLAFVILLAVVPLAWHGTSCGHDTDFHLQNWLEVNASWHQGVFYPHWAMSPNYQAGEPRFVFYPPLSWLLGGLLGTLLPWNWTPSAFTLIALFGAGFGFRAMAREWMPEENATIAACLYVANPYMLFAAYERGAMAELLAAAWLPLLVLYGLRQKRAVLPLAFSVAAVWLTNAPAAVMGSYMLAALVAIASLQAKSWRLIVRAAIAVPLGLGLASFWLIPAICEQRWVEINRAIGPLMSVDSSFLFGSVDPSRFPADENFGVNFHNHVLWKASWIAVSLLAGTVIAAFLSRRRRSQLWTPLVAVASGILLLQFRWSTPLWRLIPKLQFLQFPWRWMAVLGLIFAAFAGLAVKGKSGPRRSLALGPLLLTLLACELAIMCSLLFWQPCDVEDNPRAQVVTFHSNGFGGADEYTPQPADNSEVQQGLPQVRLLRTPDAEQASSSDNPGWTPALAQEIPESVRIESWKPNHMSAAVTVPQPGYAVLRLMDYPAWQVTVNGANLRNRTRRDDGLMVVPVNPGTAQIDIRWNTTRDEWAGLAVSLATLAVTLATGVMERRRIDGNRIG